jgi:hypothetical protein
LEKKSLFKGEKTMNSLTAEEVKELAEELKARIDIVDVVSDYVSLRKQGQNHFGLCPFHSERTPSFSVHQDKQIFKCFGCGKGGDIYTFLREIEGIDFRTAVQKVSERCQHTSDYRRKVEEFPTSNKLDEENLDRISRELQHHLTLSPEHLALLLAPERGMTVREVEIRGYRSFPEKPWEALSKVNQKDFDGYPGAYLATHTHGDKTREYWTLNRSKRGGGILIPIHNERNHIVGWQIRLDHVLNVISTDTNYTDKFNCHLNHEEGIIKILWDGEIISEIPEHSLAIGEKKAITIKANGQKITLGEISIKKGQKYFWLASGNKPRGTEAGNPLPIHVAVPTAIRQQLKPGQLLTVKKVYITEGPIKADIAAEKMNEVFIGIPGLSAWRQAMQTIENMECEHAVLAFDMDIARKEELRDQIKLFKEKLEEMPRIQQVDIALWSEEQHGKGIDDVLLRGHFPQIRALVLKDC